MGNNFTPEPWCAEGIENMSDSNIHIVAKNHLGEIVGNGRHSIAVCSGPDKIANALLIRTAPKLLRQRDELLEALQTIASYPALSPLPPLAALDNMRQIARAAIAAATKEAE